MTEIERAIVGSTADDRELPVKEDLRYPILPIAGGEDDDDDDDQGDDGHDDTGPDDEDLSNQDPDSDD
jgi:hypothetical protein